MKHLLFVFVIVCIFSCSGKNEISIDPLSFISDTTVITIDRRTEPYTRTLQYVNGDLYWWNSNRETISVIALTDQMVKNFINLERDGPNGLGNPLGFFVMTPDSIYIPTMPFELSLINSQGNWIADYDYYQHSLKGDVAASMTRYSGMIQTNNSGVLYLRIPDLKHLSTQELTEENLEKYPLILSFNSSEGTFNYLEFNAPPSLLEFNDFIDFGITATDNSLLLLHAQSNSLLSYDFKNKKCEEYFLQSKSIRNFSNEYYLSPRMSLSVEENMRLAYKSAENFGLTFDSYKNLLYRFGWPGEEIPQDADPTQFSATPPYFVISIYDGSDFSLIKEFTLPRNTYLAHHYFVDKKGLNLFPMHPDNPEFNEDEMVIHTFDFSRLK
jgi:hypothetical protein